MEMDPDIIERYDRQIRLWGQHGQNKCSSSKICLINANSLGTEVLKGLCLAGIGSFVLLDSHKLTLEDVGCNFIPHTSIGKGRGESVKQMLLDLNEEVCGEVCPIETYLPHISQDMSHPIDDSSQCLSFWKQFNCVIACGFLYTDQITRLCQYCWMINVPLILCKSIGFFGSMRSQLREHLIIESHPDNQIPDFSLDRPFKELKDYFDSIDLEDESKLGSYPYVVIIYKYLKVWQSESNFLANRLPNTYSEKRRLKTIIDEGFKNISKHKGLSIAGEVPYENFIEASRAVFKCFSKSDELPKSVEDIFDNPKLSGKPATTQNLPRFWLIMKALKEFVQTKNDGRLPISGSIPDMISSSEEYVRLQAIYARKSRADADSVLAIVQNIVSSTQPSDTLCEEIKLVCKNIRNLQMISTEPIHDSTTSLKDSYLRDQDEEDEFITISVCLNALDLFFSTYSRMPGHQDDQVEVDISKLKDCVRQIFGKLSNRLRTLEQCLYEICRCGGAELHATSAFLGGCVAQEVIKLITNQYVPVDDTLVYNAMLASTKTLKFRDTFIKS